MQKPRRGEILLGWGVAEKLGRDKSFGIGEGDEDGAARVVA
jgi:hypothetical protein